MRYIILVLPFHRYDGEATSSGLKYAKIWINLIRRLRRNLNHDEPTNVRVKIIHSEEVSAVKDAQTIADTVKVGVIRKAETSLRRRCGQLETISSILSPKDQKETDVLVIAAHPDTISCLVDFFIKNESFLMDKQEPRYAGYIVDCSNNQIRQVPSPRASLKR